MKDHTSAIILWEIMYLLGIVFYNGTHHFEHSDLGSACNSWSKSKTCSELQTNKKTSVYSNMLGYNHIEKTRAAPWLGISSGSGHTCGLEQRKGIVVLAWGIVCIQVLGITEALIDFEQQGFNMY